MTCISCADGPCQQAHVEGYLNVKCLPLKSGRQVNLQHGHFYFHIHFERLQHPIKAAYQIIHNALRRINRCDHKLIWVKRGKIKPVA